MSGFESVRTYYESESMREGRRNLNGEYRIPQSFRVRRLTRFERRLSAWMRQEYAFLRLRQEMRTGMEGEQQ
jgi:hypothetical protein